MRFITALATVSLLATACAKDPSTGVTAARVSDQPAKAEKPAAPAPSAPAVPAAAEKPAPTTAAVAPGEVKLAGDITFVGSKVTGSHSGKFTNWAGSATVADGKLAGIQITVQTTDVVADFEAPTKWSAKLEAHLREPDFFDSEKHPTATFALDQVKAAADSTSGATHDLSGQLTIRGITKAISFPAKISSLSPFAAEAKFSINRKDFNMTYDGKADNLIRDNVVLKINIKAAS